MKFLASLFCGMFLSIILILLLGLVLKCDHNNIIEVYSFQPEKSTAVSSIKSKCADCGQSFSLTRFRDNPPNETYIDVIKEHCDDKTFIKGEYDTIKATVVYPDYDFDRTRINCSIRQDEVDVYFTVDFKSEYEEAVSLLQSGDEITFYGKSALKGVFWSECELVK